MTNEELLDALIALVDDGSGRPPLEMARDRLARPEAGIGLRRWHETRMRAFEEAAALCDKEATYGDQDDYGAGRVRGAEACAEAIRALKDKHSPQQESP